MKGIFQGMVQYQCCLKLPANRVCVYRATGKLAVKLLKMMAEICTLPETEAVGNEKFELNLIEIGRNEIEKYSMPLPEHKVYFEPFLILQMHTNLRSYIVYVVDSPKITESRMGFLCRRVYYLPILLYVLHHDACVVHGVLCRCNGKGAIISGPSGIGKSTAARRLPEPWEVLADDCMIVSRIENKFIAMIVPTWSIFYSQTAPVRSYDVSVLTEVEAIFMLDRGVDRVEVLQPREAFFGFTKSIGDMTKVMTGQLPAPECKLIYDKSFELGSALTKTLKCFHLFATLEGKFWERAEDVL